MAKLNNFKQQLLIRKVGDIVFEEGFPCELQDKVHKVLGKMSLRTYNNMTRGVSDEYNSEEYILLDGSTISFPYRIYFIDDEEIYHTLEDREEQFIYSCIYTRSCDGYVRQKYLKKIMENDFPHWCMPYILKLSSEYVIEITEDIYEYMKIRDCTLFQMFCKNNPYVFRYSHSRMTSYWNEFYRCKYYKFHNYVGYKLYKECFGYSRKYSIWKK